MGRAKANFLPLGEETYTIAVRMTLNINVAHIVHHSFFFHTALYKQFAKLSVFFFFVKILPFLI